MFVIIFILLASFVAAFPSLKSEMLPNGSYITRERTCLINGFFIWFVFVRHMGDYFPNGIAPHDYVVYKPLRALGQCVVATFFFYSGFGLMTSLCRGGYVKSLMLKRLPMLWFYLAVAISTFLGIQACYGNYFSLEHILQAYVAWKSVGNSTWFICITLISYPIIALSYILFHRKGEKAVAGAASVLFLLLVYAMYRRWGGESHWYNTSLCIPAGMWFFIYRTKVEQIVKRAFIPAWVWGMVFTLLALLLYRLINEWPYLHNIAAMLFALGITLVFSCISLKKQPTFLCWSGGAGLFFIYIFQRIPMLVGEKAGWSVEYPFAYQLFCVVTTLLIALGCCKVLPKLANSLFFRR